jgi:methylglyoxal reductase
MQTRPLGQSGIEASVIGLGTWAIGGWMWGSTSENDSVRAIHTAIDSGVNLIDTAPIYGFGLAEQVVGRAIHDRRNKVVLATKCGMICSEPKGEIMFRSTALGLDPDGHITIRRYLGPESIRAELEASLRRLQTDHVDLYQTHWQDESTPIEETMGTLMDLQREGKIRAIGVSNASAQHMASYRRLGEIASDQEKFSMIDREIEEDQLPYCREHDIAVLAYSPLARGLLTGKVGPDREFEDGDQRLEDDRFTVDNRRRVLRMLERCRPIAKRKNITITQLVLAWTVRQPGLTHALVGARNPQQAEENATADSIELNDEEMDRINQAIDEHAGVVASSAS